MALDSSSGDEIDKIACEACKTDSDDDSMLLCDGCDRGYHLYCLRPILEGIPKGKWYCPVCLAQKDAKFRNSLEEGSDVRAQDRAGKWLEAKVAGVKTGKLLIHFLGWNSRFDEWFPRNSSKLQSISTPIPAPSGVPKKKAESGKTQKEVVKVPKSGADSKKAQFTSATNCQRCRGRHVAHTCGFRATKDTVHSKTDASSEAGAIRAKSPVGKHNTPPATKISQDQDGPKRSQYKPDEIQAWFGKTVRLVSKSHDGKTGRVESASNGYYTIKLAKPATGELRVRQGDMENIGSKAESGGIKSKPDAKGKFNAANATTILKANGEKKQPGVRAEQQKNGKGSLTTVNEKRKHQEAGNGKVASPKLTPEQREAAAALAKASAEEEARARAIRVEEARARADEARARRETERAQREEAQAAAAAEREREEREIESHPSVRLVVGNRSKFVRTNEKGQKMFSWTVFVKTEAIVPDSSSSESEDESDEEETGKSQAEASQTVTPKISDPPGADTGSSTAGRTDASAADVSAVPASQSVESAGVENGTIVAADASIVAPPGDASMIDDELDSKAASAETESKREAEHTSEAEAKAQAQAQAMEAEAKTAKAAKAVEKKVRAEERAKKGAESEAAAGDFVKSVTYVLHESYDPPVVTVNEAPFEVTREGWGIFIVQVHVASKHGSTLNFNHALSISRPESKKMYEVDLATGKLIRRRMKVETVSRRPERERRVIKPRGLDDFVESSGSKPIVKSTKPAANADAVGSKPSTSTAPADTKGKKRQLELDNADNSNPLAYEEWKRQVLGREPGEDAAGSVVSPQWLKHFQHVSSSPKRKAEDLPRSDTTVSNKWCKVVTSHLREISVHSERSGLSDLEALLALWPKMHQAVATALHKLPAVRSDASGRVARYLLSQYKLAQAQTELEPPTSPKASPVSSNDQRTMLVDVPGARLRALSVHSGEAGGDDEDEDEMAPSPRPGEGGDPAFGGMAPISSDAGPISNGAIAADEFSEIGVMKSVRLRLSDPRNCINGMPWDADEAEILENAIREYQHDYMQEQLRLLG